MLSYVLYRWRGGFSASFLLHGTACLSVASLLSVTLGFRRLRAGREMAQSRFFAGDNGMVAVTVRRGSMLPAGWIVATDVWTDGSREFRHSRLLLPGFRSVIRYRYRLKRLARGRYRFVRLELEAGDWLGLLRKRVVLPSEAVFAVCPKPLAIDLRMRTGQSDEGSRTVAAPPPESQAAAIAAGVRPYIAGDPLRRIHWKASARTGSWKTRMTEPFEPERLAVVIDCDRSAYAGETGAAAFELSVRAAAGLAEFAVRQDMAVGLYASGSASLRISMERRAEPTGLFELLCRVRPDGETSAAETLMRLSAEWPPGCRAVLVTGRLDEALVRAARILSYRRHALSIWTVPADPGGAEPALRIARELESMGCAVVRVSPPYAYAVEPGGAEDVIA
jgi:uncharacterized protein (DUF58 family)